MTFSTVPSELYGRGVYFMTETGSFSYVEFCLADGLDQLGIPVFSPCDATHPSTPFRFRATPGYRPDDAWCLVLSVDSLVDRHAGSECIIEPLHERTIGISMHDNLSHFVCRSIPLLVTHETSLRRISGTRIPIAFGISTRLLQKTISLPPYSERDESVLRTFHPSLRQDVRAFFDLSLVPMLSRRCPVKTLHTDSWDEFINLLKQHRYILAYGGTLNQNLMKNPFFASDPACQAFHQLIDYRQETVVTRWDSWRLWEAFAAGGLVITLDFDRFGFELPVKPENWVHYVGIDPAHMHEDIERFHEESHRHAEIAEHGRRWAIEHYTPVPVARRFIETVCSLFNRGKS